MYQRYVSPYKGYICAFRVHTGRCSCSEFARRVVLKHGIMKMMTLLPRRFGRCQDSYLAQMANQNENKEEQRNASDPSFCCKEGAFFTVGCCPWP
jgi:uncharacterized protein